VRGRIGFPGAIGQKHGARSDWSEEIGMPWIILFVAGLFEVGWAIGLKYSDGLTRLWPTVSTVLAMVVSLWLLGIAMRSLPVGTAYAVWVGVGAVGTVILGIVLFDEPANTARLMSVALIVRRPHRPQARHAGLSGRGAAARCLT
jgi:quaternary ammonium compound-resistance protein SugE